MLRNIDVFPDVFALRITFRKRSRLRSQRTHFAGRHADRTSRLQTKPPSSGQTDAGLSFFGRNETYQLLEQPELVHTGITDIYIIIYTYIYIYIYITIYSLRGGLAYHVEFEKHIGKVAK